MKEKVNKKILSVIVSAFLLYLAVFQLLTLVLLVINNLIEGLADKIPLFFYDLFFAYYSVCQNAPMITSLLSASVFLILISGILILIPIVKNNEKPKGKLYLQKIACIISVLVITIINIINFSVFFNLGFFALLNWVGFNYFLYSWYAVILALLFIISSKDE